MNTCPGCGKDQPQKGMCAYCRTAAIEMRAVRNLDSDELLNSLRALVEKYTSNGLDQADIDTAMIAFRELDYRAVRGIVPEAWDVYGDDEDWQVSMEPPRSVETIRSDKL